MIRFLAHAQGRIKTLGAPCQRVMGALPSPSLSGSPLPPLPSLPFPFLPSPPLPYPSPPVLSPPLEVGPLNTARGSGERCKLPQWGLGQSPSRQTIWCVFESKRATLVAAIFCGVFRKNICNFHYFLHKNN